MLPSGVKEGDRYLYAEYGKNSACTKFPTAQKLIKVGPNPGSVITFHLDKTFYTSGQDVNITGNVGKQINFSDPNIDIEVRMDVFDQSLSRPETEFIPLNEDGSFSTSFETISAGRHTVQITYDKKSSEALYVTR